jgi:hypothetical protein
MDPLLQHPDVANEAAFLFRNRRDAGGDLFNSSFFNPRVLLDTVTSAPLENVTALVRNSTTGGYEFYQVRKGEEIIAPSANSCTSWRANSNKVECNSGQTAFHAEVYRSFVVVVYVQGYGPTLN